MLVRFVSTDYSSLILYVRFRDGGEVTSLWALLGRWWVSPTLDARRDTCLASVLLGRGRQPGLLRAARLGPVAARHHAHAPTPADDPRSPTLVTCPRTPTHATSPHTPTHADVPTHANVPTLTSADVPTFTHTR